MIIPPLDEFLKHRAQGGLHTKVVAFGSSNTERRSPGMHWFDLFEIAYKATHGRNFTCINAGVGGNTAGQLLDRIERDCLDYRPNVTFITVGGNDANPLRNLSEETFRTNLTLIVEKLKAIDCIPVLQTYYAPDRAKMDPVYAAAFERRMAIIREVACAEGVPLIDHLARWERLRDRHYSVYLRLMQDAMHLQEAGNLLLGHDLIHAFGLQCPDDPYYRESFATHTLLSSLCP